MLVTDALELQGFPVVIRPSDSEASARTLVHSLSETHEEFSRLLIDYGALLFRGFNIEGAKDFEAVCRGGTPNLLTYAGGGSPRSSVSDTVYTSTEYSAARHIPLHCEESYFKDVPHYAWFYCDKMPTDGGETPIGDMQGVLDRLDDALIQRFDERGVQYIYNLHGGNGFGRGWKDAFQTEDRNRVEAWLEEQHISYQWREKDTLHMDLLGPGLRTHSETGAVVWGNQAANWHVGGLGRTTAANLRRIYKSEHHYPKHAVFGDGSPIPEQDIHQILEALATTEIAFAWSEKDILLCDNQRVAHGRRPFRGNRRILVALA